MPVLREKIILNRGRLSRYKFTISGSDGAVEDVSTTSCALFVVRNSVPSGSIGDDTDSAVVFRRALMSGCGITATASGFIVEFVPANTASLTLNEDGQEYTYEFTYIPTGETYPVMVAKAAVWINPNIARGL